MLQIFASVTSACLSRRNLCRLYVAAALALCGSLAPLVHAQSETPKLSVVATTNIIEETTRAIAGEDASVSALMGEGVDPHLYKASPGDMRRLSQADLVLYNGLHLEGKMADALEKLSARKPVVAVSERIPRDALRQPKEFQGNYDPHIWFDVSLWTMAAERIRDALIDRDPIHSAGYSLRFEAYRSQLKELDLWVRREVASIPKSLRVLVTAHDAFGYFGRAYDVEVLAIQGMSTDSEASLQDINHLVATLVSRKVPAVFVESSVSQKAVQALVEGTRSQGDEVKIGGELFSDSLGRSGTPDGTYIGMVRHNVTTIKSALTESSQ